MKIILILCLIFAGFAGSVKHLNRNQQCASVLANFAGKEAKTIQEHSSISALKAQAAGLREDLGVLLDVDRLEPLFLAQNLKPTEATMQTANFAADAAIFPSHYQTVKSLEQVSRITHELIRSMSSAELDAVLEECKQINAGRGWCISYDVQPLLLRQLESVKECRGKKKNISTFKAKVRNVMVALKGGATCRDA